MNSITFNLVSSATPTPAETLHDPQAQGVHTTTALAAMPGSVEPLPAAQSSLAAFVPDGGLHPAGQKPGDAMLGGFTLFVAAVAAMMMEEDKRVRENLERAAEMRESAGQCIYPNC